MEQVRSEAGKHAPSSQVLAGLLHQAPPEYFTLGWLISNLHQRSFGIVILVLGLLATSPIGSTIPGLMLATVAFQMIAGRGELAFLRLDGTGEHWLSSGVFRPFSPQWQNGRLAF